MKKLTILRGLPCSGKSTHVRAQQAKHDDVVRVNRDALRSMLHADEFNPQREKVTNFTRDFIIRQALAKGYHVIVDDTNLRPDVVQHLRKLAGPDTFVEEIVFEIDVDEAIRREMKRRETEPDHVEVPEKVIRKMHKQWQSWRHVDTSVSWDEPEEGAVEWIDGLPEAVMCDLDGTLAHMVARGPYEHMKCETDELDARVAQYLYDMSEAGYYVILMSGRDDESREATEQWLKVHGVHYDHLHMRSNGDTRKDSIVKRELFNEHVRGKYNIHVVLDDRNQVVDEWRKMGLVVWQVAPGDF